MTPSSALTLESAPGVGQLYVQIPNSRAAARRARDWLAGPLRATHPLIADDVLLCLSEVVANVYRHTTTPTIRVETLIIEPSVVVRVHDNDPGPLPKPADPGGGGEIESGRGLTLIDACADAWGVTVLGGPEPRGKAFWFTLLGRPSSAG